MQKTLGSRLRELRTLRGLTCRKLAESAGINPTHYSRLEKDRLRCRPETLTKIAIALKHDAEELQALNNKHGEQVQASNHEYDEQWDIFPITEMVTQSGVKSLTLKELRMLVRLSEEFCLTPGLVKELLVAQRQT